MRKTAGERHQASITCMLHAAENEHAAGRLPQAQGAYERVVKVLMQKAPATDDAWNLHRAVRRPRVWVGKGLG